MTGQFPLLVMVRKKHSTVMTAKRPRCSFSDGIVAPSPSFHAQDHSADLGHRYSVVQRVHAPVNEVPPW